MEKKKTNKKFTFVLIGLVTLGVVYGGYKYNHSLSHETTDDAQVEQNMTPIIPRVTGFIEKIYVKDMDLCIRGLMCYTLLASRRTIASKRKGKDWWILTFSNF